jgi:hypothetical protein
MLPPIKFLSIYLVSNLFTRFKLYFPCLFCLVLKIFFGVGGGDQCFGAETICFDSGSDFQKVSAPAPAPTEAFWVPVFTAFK